MVQDLLNPKPGDYVVCKYDDRVLVTIINSYDEEFHDFKVQFLYPSGYNKYYNYPEIKDSCHLNKKYILKILATLSLKSGTQRIQYHFKTKEIKIMK